MTDSNPIVFVDIFEFVAGLREQIFTSLCSLWPLKFGFWPTVKEKLVDGVCSLQCSFIWLFSCVGCLCPSCCYVGDGVFFLTLLLDTLNSLSSTFMKTTNCDTCRLFVIDVVNRPLHVRTLSGFLVGCVDQMSN